MMFQTLGTKVGSVAAQLVLARLLTKDDFGLVALAYTVTSFVWVLQQSGLKQILIQRQAHFDRWVHAGFWLSVAISVTAFVVMVIAGPITSMVFHNPQLTSIVFLVACCSLLEGFCPVPNAILERDLRFRVVAKIGLAGNLTTSGLSMVLAVLGAGAYSFVVPLPIVSLGRFIAFMYASGYRPVSRLYFRRWRYLLSDSGMMLGTSLAICCVVQGDNLMLGLFHSKEVLGVYFFAYNLSTQTGQLVAANLGAVLMPALTKLVSDPPRQLNAAIRATRVMLLIGMPLCFLQAALVEPAITIFFHGKWDGAGPVVQFLSVGMAMTLVTGCATSVMQSQGRFRFLLAWNVVTAAAFLVVVAIGARLGAAMSVSIAVAAIFTAIGPTGLYLALRPTGGRVRDVLSVYFRPALVSACALAASVAIQHAFPGSAVARLLVGLAAFGATMMCGYALIARKDLAVATELVVEMKNRMRKS
jgi:PST family polysaccharide transporter